MQSDPCKNKKQTKKPPKIQKQKKTQVQYYSQIY